MGERTSEVYVMAGLSSIVRRTPKKYPENPSPTHATEWTQRRDKSAGGSRRREYLPDCMLHEFCEAPWNLSYKLTSHIVDCGPDRYGQQYTSARPGLNIHWPTRQSNRPPSLLDIFAMSQPLRATYSTRHPCRHASAYTPISRMGVE